MDNFKTCVRRNTHQGCFNCVLGHLLPYLQYSKDGLLIIPVGEPSLKGKAIYYYN